MRRRISKDLIDSKRSELLRAKEQREKFRTILDGKDTPFWKEVVGRIDSKKQAVEAQLDEWSDVPERKVWAFLEQRKMLRFFQEMVDESGNVIEVLEKRIDKLETELKGMRVGEIA
jgi:hypothetical protein